MVNNHKKTKLVKHSHLEISTEKIYTTHTSTHTHTMHMFGRQSVQAQPHECFFLRTVTRVRGTTDALPFRVTSRHFWRLAAQIRQFFSRVSGSNAYAEVNCCTLDQSAQPSEQQVRKSCLVPHVAARADSTAVADTSSRITSSRRQHVVKHLVAKRRPPRRAGARRQDALRRPPGAEGRDRAGNSQAVLEGTSNRSKFS